ncbi:hypothetical protein GQ53DRAFT_160312 [Thozetella sp. PMI_491]|nr:hypothetical protein GQ53DRAFT_160312 [Thozetella sp. PMI_491]
MPNASILSRTMVRGGRWYSLAAIRETNRRSQALSLAKDIASMPIHAQPARRWLAASASCHAARKRAPRKHQGLATAQDTRHWQDWVRTRHRRRAPSGARQSDPGSRSLAFLKRGGIHSRQDRYRGTAARGLGGASARPFFTLAPGVMGGRPVR